MAWIRNTVWLCWPLLCGQAFAAPVSFSQDIAPILQARCVMCHNGSAAPKGLALDSYVSLRKGSSSGAVVIAGKPAESELLRRLTGQSQPRMPMTGPPFLSETEIGLFQRWIAEGATNDSAQPMASTSAPRPTELPPSEFVTFRDVAPIFATRCSKCHAEQGLLGSAPEGYRLTSYEAVLSTADRARMVPGYANSSELMRRVRGQALPRMPLDGPPYLSEPEIARIERWINDGARNAQGKPAAYPMGAVVRLHGTLDANGQLDGVPLHLESKAAKKLRASPGDRVQVRGHLRSEGEVEADRIRSR